MRRRFKMAALSLAVVGATVAGGVASLRKDPGDASAAIRHGHFYVYNSSENRVYWWYDLVNPGANYPSLIHCGWYGGKDLSPLGGKFTNDGQSLLSMWAFTDQYYSKACTNGTTINQGYGPNTKPPSNA